MNDNDPIQPEVSRDKLGHFVPGQSGNPSGRAPGSLSLVSRMKKYLRDNPEVAERLARAAVDAGIDAFEHRDRYGAPDTVAAGNAIFKTILDRAVGVLPKETIHSGELHMKRLLLDGESVDETEEGEEDGDEQSEADG